MGLFLWLLLILGWILICKFGIERPASSLAVQNAVLAVGWLGVGLLNQQPWIRSTVGATLFFVMGFGASYLLGRTTSILGAVSLMVLGTAAVFVGVPAVEIVLFG